MYLFWNGKQPQDSEELFWWAPPTHPASQPRAPLAATATLLPSAPPPPPEPSPTSLAAPAHRRKMALFKVSPRTDCGIVSKPYSESHTDTTAGFKGFCSVKCWAAPDLVPLNGMDIKHSVPDGFGHQHSWGMGKRNPPCIFSLFVMRLRGLQAPLTGGPSQLCSIQTGGEG